MGRGYDGLAAIVMGAQGPARTQMSENPLKQALSSGVPKRSRSKRSWTQKDAKECTRALSHRNCKQPGLKQPVLSRSPKAGHPKAGRSDFRNQRFETDTRKMRKVLLTQEKQGSEEIPQSKNAENADTKTRKMRMTGFNVTGLGNHQFWELPISA